MVISRYEGKGQAAENLPPSLSLLFAAEFTGPPQKPPRLVTQVRVGSAETANGFESGLPKNKERGL